MICNEWVITTHCNPVITKKLVTFVDEKKYYQQNIYATKIAIYLMGSHLGGFG